MTPPDTIYLAAVGSDDQGPIWELMPEHAHEDGDPMYIRADLLSDPVTVHVNMLRGTIAKPTLAQIAHIYGDEWTVALATARADGLREAARVAFRICAETRHVTLGQKAANAILAGLPPRPASGPIDPAQGFATTGAEARWIADTDAWVYDDAPCPTCGRELLAIGDHVFCPQCPARPLPPAPREGGKG